MKTLILIIFLVAVPEVIAQEQTASAPQYLVGHGKYIVDHVAMCIQCHTPRDESGNLLLDKYLEGAPVPVSGPSYPNISWALKAPAIAGLIGYTKEQGVRLLMEGVTRDGRIPSPPMPPFRFSTQDAEAVVAYLQSLK